MATEKWTAGSGVGYTWTAAFAAADLNSMTSAYACLSSQGDISNQGIGDIYADISFSIASVLTTGTPYIAFYLYPLNQEGTTYGDGQFTAGTQTAGTTIPSASLWKASFMTPIGTQVLVGTCTGIIIPPGTFRWLIQNKTGVNWTGSGNACKYRTYNRAVS
jgi:hypothetical protein